MLLPLLLLQLATATPAPVPAKTPTAIPSGPRTLADYARERRASGAKATTGTFSAAQSTAPQTDKASLSDLAKQQNEAARAAQDRMNRAVRDSTWTSENIHYTTALRDAARREWDAAQENCRKTPGCVPQPRDDGVRKVLKTDDELMDDAAKAQGLTRYKNNKNENPQ